jgi:hypothetical protein
MLVYGYKNEKNIASNKQAGGDRIIKTQGVEMIKDLPKEQLEIYEINAEYMDIDSQNRGWVTLVKTN